MNIPHLPSALCFKFSITFPAYSQTVIPIEIENYALVLTVDLNNELKIIYFGEKLVRLIKDASVLGVDLFLLNDGWFANKYPRNSIRIFIRQFQWQIM
jgi:hypothetical protein